MFMEKIFAESSWTVFFFYKNISPRTHDGGGDCGSLFPSCVRCGSRNSEAWGLSASPSAPPGPPPLTLEHRHLAMILWGWGSEHPGPFSPVGTSLALGSWTVQPLRHPYRIDLKVVLPAMSWAPGSKHVPNGNGPQGYPFRTQRPGHPWCQHQRPEQQWAGAFPPPLVEFASMMTPERRRGLNIIEKEFEATPLLPGGAWK